MQLLYDCLKKKEGMSVLTHPLLTQTNLLMKRSFRNYLFYNLGNANRTIREDLLNDVDALEWFCRLDT